MTRILMAVLTRVLPRTKKGKAAGIVGVVGALWAFLTAMGWIPAQVMSPEAQAALCRLAESILIVLGGG